MNRPLRGAAKANAAKTHCKRGHEFTPENTIVFRQNGKADGGRQCRQCKNEWHKKQWHKVREYRNRIKRERRREQRLKDEGVL